MIVVSPHLDDAVFACGERLAAEPGSTVLTIFAGVAPEAARSRTEWDARCGFADAAEAIRVRRAEDERALALLEAKPRWLDFGDAQYGRTPSPQALAAALREALDACVPEENVLLPLGLFHSDHLLAHAAGRIALGARATLFYEDVPYRALPGLLQRRLAALQQEGLALTPERRPRPDARATQRKAQALRCYASQLRAFGPRGVDDAAQPERCWRRDPHGAG